jgi:hypothetical protein
MIKQYRYIWNKLSNQTAQIILIIVIAFSILFSRIYMLRAENGQINIIDLFVQVISTIVLGIFASFMFILFAQINRNGFKNIDFSVVLDKNNILRIFILYNIITIPLTLFLHSNDFWVITN